MEVLHIQYLNPALPVYVHFMNFELIYMNLKDTSDKFVIEPTQFTVYNATLIRKLH